MWGLPSYHLHSIPARHKPADLARAFADRLPFATLLPYEIVQFWPLLKSEWVGSDEESPAGAVQGGRSPAQRTLDGDCRTVQSSKAECGIVLHSALEVTDRQRTGNAEPIV